MKKVLFTLLALSALASCKKDDLPNSPSPEGKKEVVRLSLSGDLNEARELTLTPREEGGKIKLETKVEGTKLPASYLIYDADGKEQRGRMELNIKADGKTFQGMQDIDISRLRKPLKVSLMAQIKRGPTGDGTPPVKFELNKKLALQQAVFISFDNDLVEGADSHGQPHIVARNLRLKLKGFFVRAKLENKTGKDYYIKSIQTGPFRISLANALSYLGGTYNRTIVGGSELGLGQYPFPGNGLHLANGAKTTDEYLIYLDTRENTSNALALGATPVDGHYNQAIYTDFQIREPKNLEGKIYSATLTLRELENPLTYFDGKMVGKTPTQAVDPAITYSGFTQDASATPNVGYYSVDEAKSGVINVPDYRIPTRHELDIIFPQWMTDDNPANLAEGSRTAGNNKYALHTEVAGRVFHSGQMFPYFAKDESVGVTPRLSPPISHYHLWAFDLLESPNNKLVFYALAFTPVIAIDKNNGRYNYNGGALDDLRPIHRGKKTHTLVNDGTRFAMRYTLYRDKWVIEACPIGADPSIVSTKDILDKGVFTANPKVKKVACVYIPGTSYYRDGAGFYYNILYQYADRQYLKEYPIIYHTATICQVNDELSSSPTYYTTQNLGSTITVRGYYAQSVISYTSLPGRPATDYRYPIFLFKNAN